MKLTGVKVLDFSQFLAGPTVSAILADHGASVIKVESPSGDPTRNVGSGPTSDSFYSACNRGKHSIAVDLKKSESAEIVRRLVAAADIVIESYQPGVTARLGIDYASLSAINPALVYCSVTAFGQDGPLRDHPAHDPVVQATAGIFAIGRDGEPVLPAVSVSGYAAAHQATIGVLIALLAARATGRGDYLDISMHESSLGLRAQAFGPASLAVESPEGFRHEMGMALLETYQTADGKWLCLGGRENRFAKNLFDLLDRPDLFAIATGPAGAAQDPVRDFLNQTFRTRTRDEWLALFGDRISVAPVLNYAEALAHPHVTARGTVVRDDHGKAWLNTPIRFTNEPSSTPKRAAALSEDYESILRGTGFSDEQIAQLVEAGVVKPAANTAAVTPTFS
ncbi:CoA transferase [Paraburkholderia sp. CNPSo 3155]|uniref:CaiB/BaiF CoA transferase family protein n=1 Tax=Paraburkholderia atlantica TaxID=2654982 RepID=UPI00128E01A7|nr:CaiB/BaiF CoA-transferase family protein [Paraburkholderia atlantica]MPW11171.1 CoA transferase [Paraburkholderia atlantica]